MTSWRRPRMCAEDRKLNYQLILLAVVDAWSCCCLDAVSLLSGPDIEDTLKRRKGHGGHLPADELMSDTESVSARVLGNLRTSDEELALELKASLKRKKKNSRDSRRLGVLSFVYVVSVWTVIFIIYVLISRVFYVIYIYTWLKISQQGS